ncbi:MAG: class II aldolase/adducin family protein [Methylococcaceae bacterium]
MNESEGVIKYHLIHQYVPLKIQTPIGALNAWRSVFYKLELIGQVENRYDGYGFGNISQRIATGRADDIQFVITGTQTGNISLLSKRDYCLVKQVDIKNNSLESMGEIEPSSEALTHASVYQQNNKITSVIHVHSPDIWRKTKKLKLPYIADNIPYGTPEMADEVARLLQNSPTQKTGIFTMLGHEDGVVVFSDSLEEAACLLIKIYSKAIEDNQ